MNNDFLIEKIRSVMAKEGYAFFETGEYNLNLIGIRSDTPRAGKFDDLLLCVYRKRDLWRIHTWPITTDPGVYWLKNPMRTQGTAIVVPGQYRGLWQIGLHKGQYPALTQKGQVRVYRDANKDDILDFNPMQVEQGIYGINCHHSGQKEIPKPLVKDVDKWSAGCQIHELISNFNEMMTLCEKAVSLWGNSLTYTLTLESDFR